ncbi:L,D-transpeptidase family protein [Lichenihabitans psoromatis]|uniref:L,D-transpeptidase family protein n=1 Tax=Lichenihabitans psoromatis TaxID=2528642 RepID=UPI001FE0B2E9|nr:L,D-transpeptidase family protein [Lichenihabitans psoromatis]
MRTHLLRATSIQLLVVLLGTAAPMRASAASADASGLPTHAALATPDPVIAMPVVPAAEVVLKQGDLQAEVTGSIADQTGRGTSPGTSDLRAVPPALPLDGPDDNPAATLAALPNTAAPAALSAIAIEPSPASAAAAAQATPEVAPPLDQPTTITAAPVSVDAPTPIGLDAASLAHALTAFATDLPSGEKPAQMAERHKIRDAVVAFYAARDNAPLWVVDGHLSDAARSVLDRLDHASEDGLDLRRYAVPVPRHADTDALARAELALSEATIAYARQASGSRVDIAKLGGIIDLRPDVADVPRVLGTVPGAMAAGDMLRDFNPAHPGYVALRLKLAELRRRYQPGAEARIPAGPTLKAGMRDARVPLIRARFGLDVASDEAGLPALVYDTKVAAAVADFQRTNGLRASGILTPQTVAALSGGDPSRLESTILANMEQWRWLPRDLGTDHIEVNIPDFTAAIMHDGVVAHKTRVVVGQPTKPTPVFAQQMRFIIVNPYWNVPLSIIKKEMLPKLAADPMYFQNHGYEVIERNGTTFVRQPPGDGNALGRIKFMFPNDHAVYLHDTNARSFFGRDMRALSHGCVRVEQPFSFAEAVLGPENGWSEARVKKLIGGKERTIMLPKPLPIYTMYFTAFVDPQSGFQLRDDVYGYTGRVKAALGLQG